jgi:hypothetical protein
MCLSNSCKKVYNFLIDRFGKMDGTKNSNNPDTVNVTERKFENRETLNSFKNLYNAVPTSTRLPTEEDLPTNRSFGSLVTSGDSFSNRRLTPEKSDQLFQKILNLQMATLLDTKTKNEIPIERDSNSDGSMHDESKVCRKMEKFYESHLKTSRDKLSIRFAEKFIQTSKKETFYYTGFLVNNSKEGFGALRKFFPLIIRLRSTGDPTLLPRDFRIEFFEVP